MDLPQREKSCILRMVSAMEGSCLLTKSHRGATSGPVKLAADKIREMFPAMAKAVVVPYLGERPEGDSETNLPDECAMLLPQILQTFLPQEQQNRLVCGMRYYASLTISFC